MTGFTMEQLSIGQSASLCKMITDEDVRGYAGVVGDTNSVHLDEEYAKQTIFKTRVAHGMYVASLLSTVLGCQLPGMGTIYMKQDVKFLAPVKINDTVTATVTVKEKIEEKNRVILDCKVTNQDGVNVIVGEAMVMPPKRK